MPMINHAPQVFIQVFGTILNSNTYGTKGCTGLHITVTSVWNTGETADIHFYIVTNVGHAVSE